MNRRIASSIALVCAAASFVRAECPAVSPASPNTPLDAGGIPKFVTPLERPAIFVPAGHGDADLAGREGSSQRSGQEPHFVVSARSIEQQVLPSGYPKTRVFAYGGSARPGNAPEGSPASTIFSTPGPTFETTRGEPIRVTYRNELTGPHLFAVDETLMAPEDSACRIPIVTHLHGGMTSPSSDGHPFAWFTAGEATTGPEFTSAEYRYENDQLPATLWYHDHTVGMTRLNVAAGLAGLYVLRDPADPLVRLLPPREREYPLVIQDRSFSTDGSIRFVSTGTQPKVHPYWAPMYLGDAIVVNGRTWPNLDVDRTVYRFRLLNGSNARFYRLSLSNGTSMTQIGGDGGYLPAPAIVSELLLAPGERADVLIDFSRTRPGERIVLENDAEAPYPMGDLPDPATLGKIMQFSVRSSPSQALPPLPPRLADEPPAEPVVTRRVFTLNQEMTAAGDALSLLLDGLRFDDDATESPLLGTTEEWSFVNLTGDAHPIHIHLVEFQLENRQAIDAGRYWRYWTSLNGEELPLMSPPIRVDPETPVAFPEPDDEPADFLTGEVELPSPSESGWKDTIVADVGKVTRVRIRFAPQTVAPSSLVPGVNPFRFDPTTAPGYVWHCHILDHEDNDMMRPMVMRAKS